MASIQEVSHDRNDSFLSPGLEKAAGPDVTLHTRSEPQADPNLTNECVLNGNAMLVPKY